MKLERYNLIGQGGLRCLREVLRPADRTGRPGNRHVADCATPEDAAYIVGLTTELDKLREAIDAIARGDVVVRRHAFLPAWTFMSHGYPAGELDHAWEAALAGVEAKKEQGR